MMTTYQPRTFSGAKRRVMELSEQVAERNELIERLTQERNVLAKLAAKGPAFFNPLEAMAAEIIRDRVLECLGMNPDGSFKAK